MSAPIAVTDGSFEQEVVNADVPVAVDFWAPWCAPCRVVGPILDKLAKEYEGKIKIAKVNTDQDQQWASKFGIQGIPTVILFKQGEEVGRMVGSRPETAYKEEFDRVLGS